MNIVIRRYLDMKRLSETEKERTRPLAWPDWYKSSGQWARLTADIPWVGRDARVHRLFRAQLMARRLSCLSLWGENVKRYHILCTVSPIIMEYGRWPNTLFIPDDPCEILLWDPTSQLLREAAITVLAERFVPAAERNSFFADVDNMSYRELVDGILQKIPIVKVAPA